MYTFRNIALVIILFKVVKYSRIYKYALHLPQPRRQPILIDFTYLSFILFKKNILMNGRFYLYYSLFCLIPITILVMKDKIKTVYITKNEEILFSSLNAYAMTKFFNLFIFYSKASFLYSHPRLVLLTCFVLILHILQCFKNGMSKRIYFYFFFRFRWHTYSFYRI